MTSLRNKIQNAFYLLCCYILYIVRGRADRIPQNLNSVLVVPAGQLGDVVCTTPVLSALRKSENNRIRICVADEGGPLKALLQDSGLVDEYVPFRSWNASIQTLKKLKKCKKAPIDAAILTGPHFRALASCYLAGIRCIIVPEIKDGFCPQATKAYVLATKFCITVPYHMRVYAPRERLRLLEPLGILSDDTTKHLGHTENAEKEAVALLAANGISEGNRFVCISAAAGNKIKQWPPERFAAVAAYVWEKYKLPSVVIGTTVDKAETEKMLAAVPPGVPIANLLEKTPLDLLKAVIEKAYIFIGVDTGPLYIAEAFGVPTIDITGPVDENEQPPIGATNRVVVPKDRKGPVLFALNARIYDEKEAIRQAQAVSVQELTDEFDDLLQYLSAKESVR